MKRTKTLALFTAASIFASAALFAQEAEAIDEEATEETVAEEAAEEEDAATDDFGAEDDWGGTDDFGMGFDDFGSDDASPTYYINAETGADLRAYIGTYSGGEFTSGYETKSQAEVFDSATDAKPYAKLNLGYSAQNSEMEFKLKFDNNSLGDYNEDILDEATARLFLGDWVIEGGKMKVVWGKGDKLHVLDNFNANDYTDFIFPEYIDRRIAEPMLRIAYNVPGTNWSVEGIYTPMMTADRFASSGIWAPYAQTSLVSGISTKAQEVLAAKIEALETTRNVINTVTAYSVSIAANSSNATVSAALQSSMMTELAKLGISSTDIVAWCVKNNSTDNSAAIKSLLTDKLTAANTAYTLALNNASSLSSDSSSLYPDMKQLRYYGHYKQPSLNWAKLESALATYLAEGELSESAKFLQYDQKQTFGLEAAFVVWKFNTRWELGYNLTKDVDGDDPWVHNNSIEWLGGFDINLFHNINLNVQEVGKYILNNGEIDGVYKTYDVDYNSDDKYVQNKVVVNLSDTFLYEKLKPEVTVIYTIENKEWCVQPKINYNVYDGMNLQVSGGYIYSNNENGEFYNFTADSPLHHNKSFVQASVRYEF